MGALPLNLGHCIIAKEFTRRERERRQVKEVEKRIERFSWKKIRTNQQQCCVYHFVDWNQGETLDDYGTVLLPT